MSEAAVSRPGIMEPRFSHASIRYKCVSPMFSSGMTAPPPFLQVKWLFLLLKRPRSI